MQTFAFLFHPLRHDDFARKFPVLAHLPPRWVEGAMKRVPPMHVSHITGVVSKTGETAEGEFMALTLTPRVMLEADFETFVLPRLVRAGKKAEELGAKILGLGAFTKIVGDRGVSVARSLDIPVTTGNSYTAASAVEGALLASERMGIPKEEVRSAVIGATGSIGQAVSHLLAASSEEITLVARNEERLETLRGELQDLYGGRARTMTDPRRAAREANLVLTVSSATGVLLEPEDLAPGSVVCDVSRPRNVSAQVYERRSDVLVIDGGVIKVPGQPDFGFDFGMPEGMVEACMAETMILALEGRYESFTLGDVEVAKVREIQTLAKKHGFAVGGFRRFERAIPDDEVEAIRERSLRAG